MLLAIASTHGSPGVTTLSLLLAQIAADEGWNVTVVEADGDGGVLAHMFPALETEPALFDYVTAARHNPDKPDLLDDYSQTFGGVSVLVASSLGSQASKAAPLAVEPLKRYAATEGVLVIVDCGRIGTTAAHLFDIADTRWFLARPDTHIALGLNDLWVKKGSELDGVETVLVGDTPYGKGDLEDLGVPVCGVVADDEKASDMVLGKANPSKLKKSALYKAVSQLVPDKRADPYAGMAYGVSPDDVAEGTPDEEDAAEGAGVTLAPEEDELAAADLDLGGDTDGDELPPPPPPPPTSGEGSEDAAPEDEPDSDEDDPLAALDDSGEFINPDGLDEQDTPSADADEDVDPDAALDAILADIDADQDEQKSA